MSRWPKLPGLLLCGVTLAPMAGCHHRSAVWEESSAASQANVGAQAETHSPPAVQSMNGDELKNVKTTRIEDLFAGRFAGVLVERTQGGGISVRIKGAEPLVIVDGLKGDSHLLVGLRPEDIARIDVLKEPDVTAIYGERGRNGVIRITTKHRR